MSLNTAQVLETLEKMDLLDLGEQGMWPGEPEGYDVCEIDWAAATGQLDGDNNSDFLDQESAARWSSVADELERRARQGQRFPSANVLDVLAWYQPIHFFGPEWGIYIKEDAVLCLAASIWSSLDSGRQYQPDAARGSVGAALIVLYLHEAFHHKVECFAIRLETVERSRRYLPYQREVYGPLRLTTDHLEEGLACAQMITRLNEPTYRRWLPDDVHGATLEMLHKWIPTLPHGYDQGIMFSASGAYERARNRLSSQVHEAEIHPIRNDSEWSLMPNAFRGFFNWRTVANVLVPRGSRPLVSWFDQPSSRLSVSTRKLVKMVRSEGYKLVPGGKGSHRKYKASGRPMVIIPEGRESLSVRVLKTTAEALGYQSVRQLVVSLGS